MPGPTGETNYLSYQPKGTVLCLGPDEYNALVQTIFSLAIGNNCFSVIDKKNYARLLNVGVTQHILQILPTMPSKELLLSDVYQAICWSGEVKSIEQKLMHRDNKTIMPVVTSMFELRRLISEKVITTDTTAAGGNASLLTL